MSDFLNGWNNEMQLLQAAQAELARLRDEIVARSGAVYGTVIHITPDRAATVVDAMAVPDAWTERRGQYGQIKRVMGSGVENDAGFVNVVYAPATQGGYHARTRHVATIKVAL